MSSCADDVHISARMLKVHEHIGEQYEDAVEPVVEEQLAKAGARLAAVLNSVWPQCRRFLALRQISLLMMRAS